MTTKKNPGHDPLDLLSMRSVVRTVLYGAGAQRRFTQESPIMSDVWTAYLDGRGGRQKLLIAPWNEVRAAEVVKQMRDLMKSKFDATRTVYNRITVATELTLDELIQYVLPLTFWYADVIEKGPQEHRTKTTSPEEIRLPSKEEVWEDVLRPPKPTYPWRALLPSIRMAGIIGFLRANDSKRWNSVWRNVLRLRRLGEPALSQESGTARAKEAEAVHDSLANAALKGWTSELKLGLPPPLPKGQGRSIYSIHRNRPALLAMKYSIKTVKADAATKLFSIQCDEITWAIIDCGIDASHPAFLDDSKRAALDRDAPLIERLKASRVRETYDFTCLHELLLGEKLPGSYTWGVKAPQKRRDEILTRINSSQNIDWELLRPFLRVPHDEKYKDCKPADSHGTHVAGILGANWPRGSASVVGMCPDIRLIDIRVCRDDGSSDEFIIISALQFLRYLNSISDDIYVHGANMSLSIPYDITAFGCGQTLVCSEANRTVAAGIVVVAAAGNFGYRRVLSDTSDTIEEFCPVSITDPGNAELVVTVGSTHRIEPHTYGVSYFSSRGPTGDGRIKPDLLAPGEKILGPALDETTLALDGTSMAAPHVSGAAAMLMARHRELRGKPAQIKKILCSTATSLEREAYFQGHGLVDVLRALQSM
jgi:serine protease AprX